MKRLAPLLFVLVGAIGAGALWWSRRPEPPPEPAQVTPEEGDTGFSRAVTEERMRAIGYVQ